MRHLALAVVLPCVLSGVARLVKSRPRVQRRHNRQVRWQRRVKFPRLGATAPQPSSTVVTIILTIITIFR